MSDKDDVRFSRSGKSSPLGKCTEDIRIMVPEELKVKLLALSAVQGVTLSEYVRQQLDALVYGQYQGGSEELVRWALQKWLDEHVDASDPVAAVIENIVNRALCGISVTRGKRD